MTVNELIDHGNELRALRQPEQALACYAQAFALDRKNPAAFNNYGNVLREVGDPEGAIPFLEYAVKLAPTYVTAQFNLAVANLLSGNLQRGWQLYESRWNYEHLAGTLPKFTQPQWHGEDLKGKTILVVGEQGHGDNVQFVRFIFNLHAAGATVKLQVTKPLIPLLNQSNLLSWVGGYNDDPGDFDYWVPIMSLPGRLGITLENLPKILGYLGAEAGRVAEWAKTLGAKKKIRVGFGWSGRRDSWLNGHKGMPFEYIIKLIKQHPEHEWINLQADATDEETAKLVAAGVQVYPGSTTNFADTAALMHHLDLVISVDTVTAHLAGALSKPVWIMLNNYAVDWRWLIDKNTTRWYPSAVLFRQDSMDNWDSVLTKLNQHLRLYKI